MNINYKYSTLALAIVALLTGCGAEDNKDIGSADNNIYAPIVKGDVTIPALHVGESAQGIYQYFDPNPVARSEGTSLYRWYDVTTDSDLGTKQTLDVTYAQLNDSVQFCVTPVAQGSTNNSGDEVCSDLRVVQEPLGEKPAAASVALDNVSPTVGETLTGSYDYSHPDGSAEGNTSLSWYADASLIVGATANTLTLLPHQTEGKAVKFCVIPETNAALPVRGEEVCSDVTALVLAKDGTAPEAQNTTITGAAFVGSTLIRSYDFVDADSDLEGASTQVWKLDDVVIPNETASTYVAASDNENKNVTFCVTPIAATGNPTDGVETCSAQLLITKKLEAAPVAANVAATVQSGGMAEAGQVLVSGYDFQHVESLEGASVGYWVVDTVDQPECTTAQSCEYPLTQANVGQAISFCVTPKTALGTSGAKECATDVSVNGIKLSGKLEYDQQLTAVVFGYTGGANTDGHWMIDASNQDGPAGDSSPTSQSRGLVYTIGTRATVTNDSNANGIIDDRDWVAAGNGIINAGSFVGKGVEFCLTTISDGIKCASAVDSTDVTGGMLVTVDSNVKRVIEPVRELVVNSDGGAGHTYHRPLTVTEAQLKDRAGFGASIPNNSGVHTANGIDWAMFKHKELDLDPTDLHAAGNADIAVNVCRNLYSDLGEWYLPITYKSSTKYEGNYFEHANSNAINAGAPNDNINNFKALSAKYFVGDTDKLSAVFGWPAGSNDDSYAGASVTISGNKTGQFHRYRFNGGNTSTITASTPQLIICVK